MTMTDISEEEHMLAVWLEKNMCDYINRTGEVWQDRNKRQVFTAFCIKHKNVIIADGRWGNKMIKRLNRTIKMVVVTKT